ncbi:MAG TPA: MAE_28990/MAE_18760 family HEPN-like nuclease, partial [Pirellula sp.]|nr:MAE_28990/MAE_18760 family HEPN-like nuclease [Pirellula sp.]
MSKPYTETDFSTIIDSDLTWRRKELSDLKTAVKGADEYSRPVLLRAIITMSYAHWEGYVRTCANRYFEHLTLRKKRFTDFERQIYVNSVLGKLDALHRGDFSVKERCKLVNDILDGGNGRFSYVNPDLVDTRANLNTDVVNDICMICGVDSGHFEQNRPFL